MTPDFGVCEAKILRAREHRRALADEIDEFFASDSSLGYRVSFDNNQSAFFTGHAPTARPSASSRRCSPSGHTRAATPRALPGPERSAATGAGTTEADRTAHSGPGHRSAVSHTSVVTTAR